MKTTAIFVELLIVGILTLLPLILVIYLAAGPQSSLDIAALVKESNLFTTALALGLAYVVGIIADELYDSLTRPIEACIINRVLNDNSSQAWELQSRAMLKSPEAATGVEYMRGRIRILRSTIVVFPLATVFWLSAVLIRGPILWFEKLGSCIFVLALGCTLSIGAFFAYHHLTDNYWRRIWEFAQEEQKEKPHKTLSADS